MGEEILIKQEADGALRISVPLETKESLMAKFCKAFDITYDNLEVFIACKGVIETSCGHGNWELSAMKYEKILGEMGLWQNISDLDNLIRKMEAKTIKELKGI